MEQILKEILNGINGLKSDVNDLKKEQIKTNERLTNLEFGQERLEKKLDSVMDQTANLTEFRTEVNEKLENLKELKAVTKENCYEIAKIKAIK